MSPTLGVQLYTLRTAFQGNLLKILPCLAEMGCQTVELAGYGNCTVDDIANCLKQTAISAVSMHVGMEAIRRDFPQIREHAQQLGCRYVTIPGPPATVGNTAGDWRLFREELRFYAQQFAMANIGLCYHNHAREFVRLEEETTPFDILFAQPEPYYAQIDVYWVAYAEQSPIKVIRDLQGRCPTLHLKDMAKGPDKKDKPVGQGTLTWEEIIPVALETGCEHFFIEQDDPGDQPFEAVRASINYLRKQFPEVFMERP